MLRVSEHAARTDTGRQRQANEDSYFTRAPIFVVADGMGGAQAGEVASGIAAEAFDQELTGSEPAETFLKRTTGEANRRINALSQEDASRSGMGTTLTAALLDGSELSLAHVGDSRAYLFRNGRMRQITHDHSLVAELQRQGRITEQEAHDHPQRSIITRALGPEADVEVDTMTVQLRDGDKILLCTDGLTTMVLEDRLTAIMAEAESLDQAAHQMVAEANEAGGKDNITVVCFAVEEVAGPVGIGEPGGAGGSDEQPTLIGETADAAGLTAIPPPPPAPSAARSGGATAAPATPAPTGRASAAPSGTEPSRGRGRARFVLKFLGTLLVIAAVAFGAWFGTRQIYFLGADEGGRLALYRGLPYDLPFDLELYSERYSSPIQVTSIPEERRTSVTEHKLRSKDDAVSLIEDLESVAAAATAPPEPEPSQPGGRGSNSAK